MDIARWVYIADTDAAAQAPTPSRAIVRAHQPLLGAGTAAISATCRRRAAASLNYDDLAATTLLHGSPDTVIARLREMQARTGMTSLLLHYPPYYGHDKAMQSLRLFAER